MRRIIANQSRLNNSIVFKTSINAKQVITKHVNNTRQVYGIASYHSLSAFKVTLDVTQSIAHAAAWYNYVIWFQKFQSYMDT